MKQFKILALLLLLSACASNAQPKYYAFNPEDGTFIDPPEQSGGFARFMGGLLHGIGAMAGAAGKGMTRAQASTSTPAPTYHCNSDYAGGAVCNPQ